MKGIKWTLGIVLALLLLLQAAPYIVRDQAVIWLRQHGAADARLRDLKLQWWRGRLELDGLRAEAPQRLPLDIGRLVVDVDLGGILDHHLLLRELQLDDAVSGIRLAQDGQLWLGPVDLSALQGGGESARSETSSNGATNWQFGIGRIRIDRLDWRTETPDQRHRLQLQSGELSDLYQWREEDQSHLRLVGSLNGAPFDLDTRAVPLPVDKSSQLHLKLTKFPLESVAAAFVPGLRGKLTLDLDLAATLTGNDGSIIPSGHVELDDFSYRDDQVQFDNHRLTWDGKIDIALQNLMPKTLTMDAGITAEAPALKQASGLEAGLGKLNWQGNLGLAFASGAPGSLSMDGTLRLADNRVAVPQTLDGHLDTVDWKGQIGMALQKGVPQSLDVKGALGLDNAKVGAQQNTVDWQQAHWDGTLTLGFVDGKAADLGVDGQLKVDRPQLSQGEALDARLAGLDWSGKIGLHLPEESRELQLDGRLRAGQAQVDAKAFNAQLADLDWQGDAQLIQQKLASGGDIKASGIAFAQPDRLDASLKTVTTHLELKSPDLAHFAVVLPALEAQSLAFNAGKPSYPVASLASLELSALNLGEPGDLSLKQATLSGLKVARSDKGALSAVDRIDLQGLRFAPDSGVRIANVGLKDSQTRVRLDHNGRPVDIDALQKALAALAGAGGGDATAGKGEATGGKKDDAAAGWQLDQLSLSGHNRLSFEDRSTDPVFTSNIDLTQLTASALGNRLTKPSPFALKAGINRFAKLDASGALNLFGGLSNGHWKANLEGVELPALSPYSIRYIGYYLNSGQLNLKADGTLADGKLKGNNKVRINRIDVKPVDKEQSAAFDKQLSMPLQTAIALLKDDNDNIKLDFPISGSLDNPDFGYQSVINTLAEKGLKSAAMSYLTQALQPYGALISLASMAADASKSGSFINLEPVNFMPGSDALDKRAQDYLNKIADMMKSRDGLRLNICGRAVAQDRPPIETALEEAHAKAGDTPDEAAKAAELKQQLQALADNRAAAVKAYLDKDVPGDRLFLCYSKVETGDAAAPPIVYLGL